MIGPVFSVIVATYNASKTLATCLESIIKQTFRDIEIIIVDGISTDNTLEIVKGYMDHVAINVISEEDEGIYDAMNKGIRIAKGEWLYFLGSDDALYDAGVLTKIASHIRTGVDIIYGNSIWVPENVSEEGEWGYSKLLNQSINHQRIFYRKELFERLGFYNIAYKIAADHALNIRFFCEPAVTQEYINLRVAYYHSGGFTANKIDENFWNDWESIMHKNFTPYLPQKEIYNKLGWYCWYNIKKRKYAKAAGIFCKVFFHTFNITFLKHTLSQVVKAARN